VNRSACELIQPPISDNSAQNSACIPDNFHRFTRLEYGFRLFHYDPLPYTSKIPISSEKPLQSIGRDAFSFTPNLPTNEVVRSGCSAEISRE